jgi:putative oxidoreductase
MDLGLLILRLSIGLTVAAHGSQKLFGWFEGPGLAGTGGFFEKLGFRPGRLHASLAGLSEFFGGLALALGFLTPLGSALVVAVMLTAAVSVHRPNGFFITKGGWEYTLALGAAALALAFTGPGAYSLDQLLGIQLYGGFWGLAALVAGLLGGGMALVSRDLKQPAEPGPAPKAS